MCSTVFAAIDDSISQSSQQHQSISERVATGQKAIGHAERREIQVKTAENHVTQCIPFNFTTNKDLNNLVEIKNTGKTFNGAHVMTNEKVDIANGTDGTRTNTERHKITYRKITHGKVVLGNCQDGFIMVAMRFRQDQGQSALIDHIVEPPPTTRCLIVALTVKPQLGQSVVLSFDDENNFAVIDVKRL